MRPTDLDVLFTPLTLRNITLRNRFVMPGMQRGFMEDGAPTAKMVEYMRPERGDVRQPVR
jgi:2,4-dienoyl-CoA reductase-like NADH-dependent reductase (Old Yellow Enzyme family)